MKLDTRALSNGVNLITPEGYQSLMFIYGKDEAKVVQSGAIDYPKAISFITLLLKRIQKTHPGVLAHVNRIMEKPPVMKEDEEKIQQAIDEIKPARHRPPKKGGKRNVSTPGDGNPPTAT